MKIIDENGAALENPDLTLGWLRDETEAVEHPAQEGVPELSHYETVAEYPNGGKDVRRSSIVRASRHGTHGPSRYPSSATSATLPKSWRHAKRPNRPPSCPPPKSVSRRWKPPCSTFWPHRRNKNMVKFYVTQIRLHRFDGSFTIKNVPARLQAAVKEMLEEQQNA